MVILGGDGAHGARSAHGTRGPAGLANPPGRDFEATQLMTDTGAKLRTDRGVAAPLSPDVSTALDSERKIWGVIAASSARTVIVWYDFYIFGSLAAVLSSVFYPESTSAISLLKWLATFAAGFAVRPFGALVFGRIGDLVGRKYAFMMTLLIMGGSTA